MNETFAFKNQVSSHDDMNFLIPAKFLGPHVTNILKQRVAGALLHARNTLLCADPLTIEQYGSGPEASA